MVSVVKRRQDLGRWTDRLEDRLVQWLGSGPLSVVAVQCSVCPVSRLHSTAHQYTSACIIKFRRYADPTMRQTKIHQFDFLETIHEKKCMKCPRTFSLLRAKAKNLGNKKSTTLCVLRQSILCSCGRF